MLLSAEVLVVAAAPDADADADADDDDASSRFDDGREHCLFTKADTPDVLAASTSSSPDAVQIEIIVEAISGEDAMPKRMEARAEP